jgi:hypothetical protein
LYLFESVLFLWAEDYGGFDGFDVFIAELFIEEEDAFFALEADGDKPSESDLCFYLLLVVVALEKSAEMFIRWQDIVSIDQIQSLFKFEIKQFMMVEHGRHGFISIELFKLAIGLSFPCLFL